MKLYKSPNNQVFAYESDGSQDAIIPSDYAPITQEEADILIAQNQQNEFDVLPSAEKKQICKNTASGFLYNTDWTTIPDVADSSQSPYLVNQAEFIAWRSKVRKLAINPVDYPNFPPQPSPVWG